jgi:hypothetical protein
MRNAWLLPKAIEHIRSHLDVLTVVANDDIDADVRWRLSVKLDEHQLFFLEGGTRQLPA